MPVSIMPTTPRTPGRRQPIVPSPAFGLLLAGVAVSWWALATGALPTGPALCALGLTGWLASLCLHEFAHALAAYRLGDLSVADKGYLTLNPLRYADPVTSLVMPVLFLAIGGFALPGACVFIDNRALRGRHAPALVSVAGPAANLALLLLLALAWGAFASPESGDLRVPAGIALLAYLQALSLVLNLLPLPGFDGYGILRPYLPCDLRAKMDGMSGGAWLLLALGIWFVPGVGLAMRTATTGLQDACGVSGDLGRAALSASLFWL